MTTPPYDPQGTYTDTRPDGEREYTATEDRRGVAALLRDLIDETRILLQEELRLAKAELRETTSTIGRNVAVIGLGAALALAAVLALAAALNRGLTALLAQGMPMDVAVWLAPLILAVVYALVGMGLIKKGMGAIRQQRLVPQKTKQTLKEDKEWLRGRTH